MGGQKFKMFSFRDISFSVIQAKIKVQGDFMTAVLKSYMKTIDKPLKNIRDTIQKLDGSKDLQIFEETRANKFKYKIREKICLLSASI